MNPEIPFPKEKERAYKKKIFGKFIIFTLLNNLFWSLFILNEEKDLKREPQFFSKIFKNSVLVSLPLKLFIPLNEKEKLVSIYSEKKKLLVSKAYIHQKNASSPSEEVQHYSLEILKEDFKNILEEEGRYFLAYPILPLEKKAQKVDYEIHF